MRDGILVKIYTALVTAFGAEMYITTKLLGQALGSHAHANNWPPEDFEHLAKGLTVHVNNLRWNQSNWMTESAVLEIAEAARVEHEALCKAYPPGEK